MNALIKAVLPVPLDPRTTSSYTWAATSSFVYPSVLIWRTPLACGFFFCWTTATASHPETKYTYIPARTQWTNHGNNRDYRAYKRYNMQHVTTRYIIPTKPLPQERRARQKKHTTAEKETKRIQKKNKITTTISTRYTQYYTPKSASTAFYL